MFFVYDQAWGQVIPQVTIQFKNNQSPGDFVNSLKIILLLTVLTLAPSILILMTGFTRILLVLTFMRQAIGLNNLPPNQILIGISLFLTFFLMKDIFLEAYKTGIEPFSQNQISIEEALNKTLKPFRKFMFAQTRSEDLGFFVQMSKTSANEKTPQTLADVSTLTLIPAFILSELRTAFQIGLLLLVPFIIIDILVSSVLISLGMMMLPPSLITLPIKILIFVAVDGWTLVLDSLIKSFN